MPAEDEVAAEGFTVIREALRQSKMVGLGQMAVRGRDYVVAIRPCGKGLLLETLRFAEEIRSSDSVFDDIPDLEPEQEMLDLAEELIERKAAPFEAGAFESQYTEALRDLIEEKREAGAVSRDESDGAGSSGERGNIVDLMEALKKSVEKGGSKKRKTSKSKRKSKSKSDEAA